MDAVLHGRGVAVVQALARYEADAEEREFLPGVVLGLMDLEEGREKGLTEVKTRLGLCPDVPAGPSISFAESAVADLEGIRTWHGELGVPDVGTPFVHEVVSAVERLGDFSLSGRVVPDFGIDGLREVIQPPFRIVYRVDGKRVRVVRVWRGERLPKEPHGSGER